MKSLMTRLIFGTLFVLTLATSSFATAIEGDFSIGGSSATVGPTFINFVCSVGITPSCPATYGNFLVTPPIVGDFAPYLFDTGFVQNLNQGLEPLNEPFLAPNWLVFNPAGTVVPPDIALDLTFIFVGVSPQAQCFVAPAPGQICTPAIPALITPANPLGLSPVNLQNTQTGSTASFSVAGTARRISTGELSDFTGVFTAQFNVPYQTLLLTIATGGTITNSYSATFHVTPQSVPEPSTIALMLTGLLATGGLLRRRR